MALRLTRTEAGGESVWFWCGGCETHHRYVVRLGEGETGPCWEWNGDLERPTFSPSLLVLGAVRCHLYLREGVVEYLGDCEHGLAGRRVPVEPPC